MDNTYKSDYSDENEISFTELADDPLLKKCLARQPEAGLLKQVALDQRISQLDPRKLSKLGTEGLAEFMLKDAERVKEEFLEQGKQRGGNRTEAPEEDEEEQLQPAGLPEGSRLRVLVQDGGLKAKIVFSKEACGDRPPDKEEITEALAAQNIVQGIKTKYIERLAERPVYDRTFRIAEGKEAVYGKDGEVIFHFDTSLDLSPRIGEDGVADYKSLDYVKEVKAGDLLCEIIPPEKGAEGFNVFGEVLPGESGRPVEVRGGSNTILSEDGTKIFASCDGQVFLRGNHVLVSKILTVEQVDSSTGNILFSGSVHVRGDVTGGFTVHAGGDIYVNGIVENASLFSSGNIVLASGMKGQDSGVLNASGSIRALFLENVNIKVKGNLYADALINSKVECGGMVSLSGKRGCLIGGSCSAVRSVRVLNLGNEANVPTTVCLKDLEAVADQDTKNRMDAVQFQGTVKKLVSIARSMADSLLDPMLQQIVLVRIVCVKQRLEHEIRRLEKKGKASDITMQRAVKVRESIYPNTVLDIDGIVFRNNRVMTDSTFARVGGRLVRR